MSLDEIRCVLIELIQRESSTEIPAKVINSATFVEMGLDSEKLIFITGELSDQFGVDVDPVLVFENPSVDQLAQVVLELTLAGAN